MSEDFKPGWYQYKGSKEKAHFFRPEIFHPEYAHTACGFCYNKSVLKPHDKKAGRCKNCLRVLRANKRIGEVNRG